MLRRRYITAVVLSALVAISSVSVSAQQGATYEIVSSFQVAEGRPNGVIQTRDGQFYGTTAGGPVTDYPRVSGTVFAMDVAGARTTLHTFYFCPTCGGFVADGTPVSNLFEGADGSLYGTTFNPSFTAIPPGQIFRIRPAGDFTTLSRAHFLRAGVIQARDGRLYGTAFGEFSNPFVYSYGFVSLESKRMVARPRFSIDSTALTARILPQSSSRLTTAAYTAQRRAAPSSLHQVFHHQILRRQYLEPSSGLTLPPGRSRFAIASAGLTAPGQPAG